jgi:hypothetical protein
MVIRIGKNIFHLYILFRAYLELIKLFFGHLHFDSREI